MKNIYNILLLDDEEISCLGIKTMIQKLNLDIGEIYTAFNVKDAKQIVVNKKPDIIFSDINMPNENGLSFIRWVNDSDYNPKIIIVSGYDEFEYVRASFKMGVEDYILKPITREELYNTLKKTFETLEMDENNDIKSYKYKQAAIERRFSNSLDNATEIFNELNISFFDCNSAFIFFCTTFNYTEDNYFELNEYLSENLMTLNTDKCKVLGFWHKDVFVCVVNIKAANDITLYKNTIQGFHEKLGKCLNIKVRYAYSSVYNDLSDLNEGYDSCVSALLSKLIDVNNSINYVSNKSIINKFIRELQIGKLSEANQLLDQIFQKKIFPVSKIYAKLTIIFVCR